MAQKIVGDDLIKFIRSYKAKESLWNRNSHTYRNAMLRITNYNQLANEFNITEMAVKKKINNLRTCFMKEWKKVESSKKYANDEFEVYVPSMHWYREMTFLADTLRKRKPKNKKTQKNETDDDDDYDDLYCDVYENDNSVAKCSPIDPIDTGEGDDSYMSESTNLTIMRGIKLEDCESKCTTPTPDNQHSSGSPESTINVRRADEEIKFVASHQPAKDEVDDFCISLASQMKQLTVRSIVELQMDIQTLVSKKRLAEMDS